MVMILNKASAVKAHAIRAQPTSSGLKRQLATKALTAGSAVPTAHRGSKIAVDIDGRRLSLPVEVYHTTIVTQHGHVLLAVTEKGQPCCILLRPNVESARINSVSSAKAKMTTTMKTNIAPSHEMVADLRQRFGTSLTTIRAANKTRDDASVTATLQRLENLVSAPSLDDDEATALRAASLLYGTPFQVQVWQAMANVPAGQTQSYGELSRAAGGAGGQGARATAQACGANPLTLLFPCHRIVAANGKTGGYHWGYKVKEAILEAERRRVSARGGIVSTA